MSRHSLYVPYFWSSNGWESVCPVGAIGSDNGSISGRLGYPCSARLSYCLTSLAAVSDLSMWHSPPSSMAIKPKLKVTKDSQSLNRQCLILTYFLHYVSYYVLQVYNPQFNLYYNPILCHFTKRRHTRHEPHTYRSYSICSLALNRFVQRFFKHNKLGWFILNLCCIYIKYVNIFEYHVISL